MPSLMMSMSSDACPSQFEGKVTVYVAICAIIAASGGLMFGYDVGISGGVTSMDDFLLKFFPLVYERKREVKEDNYCKYDNQGLQLFTSSLYLAAIVSSLCASKICMSYGRKLTMQSASAFFFVGVVFNATAQNLAMLITGRILLGVGVGFANQAVPLFLSEIAPVHIRGGLNILFQLDVTIGILIAGVTNFYAAHIHPWGWRLSLGLAGIPAALLCLGSLLITETPTSLIERDKLSEGLAVLKKIRGTNNVDEEYQEILRASETARRAKQPFRKLMLRSSRPPLVIAVALQFFQQLTGINAIMFYAPVLFQTVGFKSDASLLSSIIMGSVNVLSTVISLVLVDRVGRKLLLLEACLQMFISLFAIGAILVAISHAGKNLDQDAATGVVILVCMFVSSFAWSWGPLGWLIPSETFPLETRTSGYAFAVSSNMLFTFIIAQAFLSMMCRMRAGIFFFFAAWIIVMGVFIALLLPETKNVPIDEMRERVWEQHWYWKRYVDEDEDEDKDEEQSERVESGPDIMPTQSRISYAQL
ncbi:sugar transport protein MST4-like [Typha latifolia]|uniref:sugar transport protein MST4-like n=1 Tax=Typha latifolia TaxID=4733 RepID=UPI003C2FA0D6